MPSPPFAILMPERPAALSTVILLEAPAASLVHRGVLLACVAFFGMASYTALALGAGGPKLMSSMVGKIITRRMGFLLAALAIQFLFNRLKGERSMYVR